MKQTGKASLFLCLFMDLMGYATYSIPVLGEFGDLLWAPLSAFVFFRLFGGWKGAFGSVFNFVEEILPGTDFIPSFTLMWLWMNFRNSGNRSGSKKEEIFQPLPSYKNYRTYPITKR